MTGAIIIFGILMLVLFGLATYPLISAHREINSIRQETYYKLHSVAIDVKKDSPEVVDGKPGDWNVYYIDIKEDVNELEKKEAAVK